MEGMLVCTQVLVDLLSDFDAPSVPPMDLGLLSLLLPLPPSDRPPRPPFAICKADKVCCCTEGAKPETAAGT